MTNFALIVFAANTLVLGHLSPALDAYIPELNALINYKGQQQLTKETKELIEEIHKWKESQKENENKDIPTTNARDAIDQIREIRELQERMQRSRSKSDGGG